MKAEAEKMIGTIDEVMSATEQFLTLDSLEHMSPGEFRLIQSCLKLIDDSKAVIEAEAEQLDRFEKKLDRMILQLDRIKPDKI